MDMDMKLPRMKGGDWKFAEAVYGSAGNQHAVGQTNVIASNYVSNGGSKNKKNKGGFIPMLVPLTLVAANTMIKSRKSTMSNKRYKKSRKSFRKSRFTRRRK